MHALSTEEEQVTLFSLAGNRVLSNRNQTQDNCQCSATELQQPHRGYCTGVQLKHSVPVYKEGCEG